MFYGSMASLLGQIFVCMRQCFQGQNNYRQGAKKQRKTKNFAPVTRSFYFGLAQHRFVLNDLYQYEMEFFEISMLSLLF